MAQPGSDRLATDPVRAAPVAFLCPLGERRGGGHAKFTAFAGLDRPVPHAQKISPVEKDVKGPACPLTRLQAAPVLGLRDF